MKHYLLLIILYSNSFFTQTNEVLKNQAFGKGVTVFYIGSGGSSRYLDFNNLKKETIEYRRSPFIVIGFDHCIYPKGSNAYWGLGVYISSWIATRKYKDDKNNAINSTWTNSLFALKLTHHNSYYVRKKLDMCSAIIIGTRIKYYHYKEVNEQNVLNDIERYDVNPAFGLSGTVRYYFYKNIAFYLEIALGYKLDLASFGLTYKFGRKNKKKL